MGRRGIHRWDTKDIPRLDGRVAVVTGANSGLGLAAATLLSAAGARVLLACRNQEKAAAAAEAVGPDAEVVRLDLASLASVEQAAADVAGRTDRLDLLVNNAGLMAVDASRTEDGFETQFGVNHLGHFALTGRLMPLLLATPGSRVVNVSSMGHRAARAVDFDDLMFDRRGYDRWKPYFQSKLANLLFTAELDRRLRAASAPTAALAAHPGGTHTDLGHEGSGFTNTGLRLLSRLAQPVTIGVLPIVRAAVDPQAQGGEFYGPQFLAVGYPVRETPSRRARDDRDARRLWDVSEQLTGVHFPIP